MTDQTPVRVPARRRAAARARGEASAVRRRDSAPRGVVSRPCNARIYERRTALASAHAVAPSHNQVSKMKSRVGVFQSRLPSPICYAPRGDK